MANILVSGLVNIETTLQVDDFPIDYRPVNYCFFGIQSAVAGVGYNIAKALTTLGNEVQLSTLVGADLGGQQVAAALTSSGLSNLGVLATLPQTCQSVILYDRAGRRQIFTDLKNIQEQSYPLAHFARAMSATDLCVLCNINFSRPFLAQARAAGKLVATDVHAISELDDAYNADYMAASQLLFMSHERLPCPPQEWAQAVLARYRPRILVIGMGSQGALLATAEEGVLGCFPAVQTRPVVSTIGAGDALFAAFVDGYLRRLTPVAALRRAMVFASHKIGAAGAADGFLTESELDSELA